MSFLVPSIFLSSALAQCADTFLWNQLTPSQDFEWVPFDYSNPNVGTVALAVIRLPANVLEDQYCGPILLAMPKAGALKAQAGFPGSVLLTQDSPGHTSMSAPSLCILGYFREYFLNGTLPPPVCPVDVTLFETTSNSSAKRAALSADEQDVLAAWKIIADSVRPIITLKFRK
ncbi:hypothetical protein K438DRAFT_1987711 [Mycena galopus ATCC 62051]|nr:hypothetical protein K438DRAFT_1987711 [Mycena galopus ATCC 62051]